MKEEIDWKKELLESGKFNNKFLKGFIRKMVKELHARNLSRIYVFQMEKN